MFALFVCLLHLHVALSWKIENKRKENLLCWSCSNCFVLQLFQLRESKGLPTIKFRPHCGEVIALLDLSFIFAWIAELLTISTICRLVMLTIWLLHSFYAIIYLMGSICGNPLSCNICITLLRLAPLDSGKHAVEIMEYACDLQRNIVLSGRNLLPFSIVVILHILIYVPVARGKNCYLPSNILETHVYVLHLTLH